jgi:hypothetical protein
MTPWLRRRLCWLLGHDVEWRRGRGRFAHLRFPMITEDFPDLQAAGDVMYGRCLHCEFTDKGLPPEAWSVVRHLANQFPEMARFVWSQVREPGIQRGVRG